MKSASVPQSSSLGSSFLAQDGAAPDTFFTLGSRSDCFRKASPRCDSDPASSLCRWCRSSTEITSARHLGSCSNFPGEVPFTWKSRVKDKETYRKVCPHAFRSERTPRRKVVRAKLGTSVSIGN